MPQAQFMVLLFLDTLCNPVRSGSEWLLECDGRLVLTVENHTVALLTVQSRGALINRA